eukprot:gene2351-8657_t
MEPGLVSATLEHVLLYNSAAQELELDDAHFEKWLEAWNLGEQSEFLPPRVIRKDQPDGELSSALGWTSCRSAKTYQPSTTDEVAEIITEIYKASKGDTDGSLPVQSYLVRATHNNFYTHNNLSCVQEASSGSATSVSLDMSRMSSLLEYDAEAHTVTAQAGMTFAALDGYLLRHGLSLPGMTVSPHMAGMSLGGALMTASHGTSLIGPATIAPYIRIAVLVDGMGEVQVLDEPGTLLEGSLGLLGVVTELTIAVSPAKKVAVRQLQEEDVSMAADLRDIIERSQAAALDVTWSPAAGMYTARIWHEAEASAPGEARSTEMHTEMEWLEKVESRLQKDQLDTHDRQGVICEILGDLSSLPMFSANEEGGETDIYDTSVGWLNDMAGIECDNRVDCFWKRAKWTPNEFSIASEDLSDWIEDVRRVMSHASGCPSFLLNMRFILGSESLLAMHTGQQVVAIEINTHSSVEATKLRYPVKQQAVLEEIVQMTMCKLGYNVPNHHTDWALATNRMFSGPCPVRDMYGDHFDMFLERMAVYDPLSLFVPPLFSAVVARQEAKYYPGCAMDGECFCRSDDHCGVGMECATGAVFTTYRVCRLAHKMDEL